MKSRLANFLASISIIAACVLASPCALAQVADSVNSTERKATKVAEGVYVIRHPDAPTGFPQGNTTVIVGDRELLVVDSCYLPSSARQDIAQIRQWSTKPVRFLVNTHWHNDHVMGNNDYWEAFSGLTIIAHAETQKQIQGFMPGALSRHLTASAEIRKKLASGKGDDGKPLTDSEMSALSKDIANRESVEAEYAKLVTRPPSLAFDRELTLDIGNREVHIKFLGRGNTKGDAVVLLPKERILIAGDLLDHPVPYLGGGFPSELVQTLGRISDLDPKLIIPGHGEVLDAAAGKAHLRAVSEFVQLVVSQVRQEVYRIGNGPRNLDAVQKAVLEKIDVAAWRQKFCGDDKDNREFFDTFSLPGVIIAAYRETWGN